MLQAIDYQTGKARWSHPWKSGALSGLLSTAGNVLFTAGSGGLEALNATTGGETRRTYYQVLQVDPAADPEVIDAAFRRLARKYHPDTSTEPDAASRMREILEAKDILGDSDRRLRYDRSIGIARRPSGIRPEDI